MGSGIMNKYIEAEIDNLINEGRLLETKQYIQHGSVSVYEHCVRVTELSLRLQKLLKISIIRKELIRGALLHDYFLYDWHDSNNDHSVHGITHPKTALNNDSQDYSLTDVEKDIILHHMFPLTLIPPRHKEALIVCVADKICAMQETIEPYLKYLTERNSHS